MKVLIISHMYPNNVNPAYGIYVHEQVRTMQQYGCEVRVISPVSCAPFPLNVLKKKWKRISQIKDQDCIEGVLVYYPRVLNFPGGKMLDKIGRIWHRMLRGKVKKLYKDFPFDIIFSHVALPDGYAGMLLAQDFGVPNITVIHGADFYVTIHRSSGCREAVKKVLQNSAKVITVSTKLKQVGGNLTNPDKIEVIPNGVSLDKVYRGASPLRNKYINNKILLAVGNLKHTKGFDLIIRALAKLAPSYPWARLLIIGSGPEAENLKDLARFLNLEEQVEFLGQLKHGAVMEYMSLADVFVLPSWREGFGVVYIEALAHGVPVIGCEGEGIADIIENGSNGILVQPQDLSSLVAALDLLLRDERSAQAMGARGRELVEQTLTWENNAKKVIALSRELTG